MDYKKASDSVAELVWCLGDVDNGGARDRAMSKKRECRRPERWLPPGLVQRDGCVCFDW